MELCNGVTVTLPTTACEIMNIKMSVWEEPVSAVSPLFNKLLNSFHGYDIIRPAEK
jgi:hypothetical protein